MKRITAILFPLLLILPLLSGCGGPTGADRAAPGTELPPEGNRPPDADTPGQPQSGGDALSERVKQMSLDEKIGQMVIVGLQGYTIDDHARELIESYRVGGFILFKDNIRDSAQTLQLINSLKEANSPGGVPLFFCVDEEGGKVSRLPGEFVKFPSNRTVGGVNDGSFSREIGRLIAEQIKSLGFNMNFAPVLDIDSNPANPVIGDRSFGADADIVAKLGVETMKGMQEKEVISVVKHFPGHGDTSVDSHIGLPVLNHGLQRLKSFELVPFAAAINNGADAIMVAHILLPQIDRQQPASLSSVFLTDILRSDLRFDGVIVTDDLTMGAIESQYEIGAAAVQLVRAGGDIVLVCHDYAKARAALDALRQVVRTGELPERRIDESVRRILKLKEKYRIADEKIASVNVERINDAVRNLLNRYLES